MRLDGYYNMVEIVSSRINLEKNVNTPTESGPLVVPSENVYSECMARKITTTVRLDEEDVEALERARADGLSTSDLIRKGLRLVAARYYRNRRPPSTGLFVSTDTKLGDEAELFGELEK
jgi:Arc/MetJ-type ribon-helix-helix transcriptional regulator